ncbi:Uu.00g121160.m01.CDS01 [Anthostomella pinea]|uniref:Uu.00g121160.m01.CDS01 n=1 Tax=Anthostomella pinea TaxID=933095 RepID=A0AAI8VGZ5_9PEZI|nr:Uu.00g121160.m01.CDS01 [Anthostomella pinea]
MHSFSFSSFFLVAACRLAHVLADLPLITDYDAYNAGAYGNRPNQTFHSSDLVSPRFLVNKWDRNASTVGSHFFMAPAAPGMGFTPIILDSRDLSLVYADPKWDGGTDARMQMYNGSQYLTFWSGYDFKGHGTGGGLMVDTSYTEFRNLTTKGLGTGADSHDFKMTGDGGVIMNNYHTIVTDLTSVGGTTNSHLLDCAFQEADVETGEVRFTWRANDHFHVTESRTDSPFEETEDGWDWFHMNAISKTAQGNYLISIRHLQALALINGTDGSRIWQVGGSNNSFRDLSGGRATNFKFQHDARFVDATEREITLFDNHNMAPGAAPTPGCTVDCTRGLRIRLDYNAMTVQVVSEFYHPVGVQAWAQGGYQLQSNGNALIGWGVVPAMTEYNAAGDIIMDVQIRPWDTTEEGGGPLYRAYRFDWVGQPTWGPSIAVVDSVVYVSWNGATEVASWALSGGDTHVTLEAMDTVPKAGFETAITPPRAASFFRVNALDSKGNVMGTTDVLDVASGEVVGSIIRH